jgi:hypothetical protein
MLNGEWRFVNYELPVASLLLISADCLLIAAGWRATAPPNPLPKMCQGGRKARKWARRTTDKKSAVVEESKKEFFKIERAIRESL